MATIRDKCYINKRKIPKKGWNRYLLLFAEKKAFPGDKETKRNNFSYFRKLCNFLWLFLIRLLFAFYYPYVLSIITRMVAHRVKYSTCDRNIWMESWGFESYMCGCIRHYVASWNRPEVRMSSGTCYTINSHTVKIIF